MRDAPSREGKKSPSTKKIHPIINKFSKISIWKVPVEITQRWKPLISKLINTSNYGNNISIEISIE